MCAQALLGSTGPSVDFTGFKISNSSFRGSLFGKPTVGRIKSERLKSDTNFNMNFNIDAL